MPDGTAPNRTGARSSTADLLVDYLANRERELAGRADDVLASMTERERALVREVAVMAGVLATRHAGGRTVPPDSAAVRAAVTACLAHPDLYPTLARLDRRARRRRTRDRQAEAVGRG